jgi:hypothetical protein
VDDRFWALWMARSAVWGNRMLRKPQLSQRLGQHDGRTDERAADESPGPR